jgi:hypothetical protein
VFEPPPSVNRQDLLRILTLLTIPLSALVLFFLLTTEIGSWY